MNVDDYDLTSVSGSEGEQEADTETAADLLTQLTQSLDAVVPVLEGIEAAVPRIAVAARQREAAGAGGLVPQTEAARAWFEAPTTYEAILARILDRAVAVRREKRSIDLGPAEAALFGSSTMTIWELLRVLPTLWRG